MASNLTTGGITTFDASRNLVPKLWSSELLSEIIRKFPLRPYVGTGSNMPIQKNTEFTRKSGTTYYYGLSMQLTGDPILDDAERAGNEQQLSIYDDAVTISQMWTGVTLKGKFEEQKYRYNLRQEAKSKLSDYFALTMDEYVIDHLSGQTARTFPTTALAPSYSGTAGTTRIYAANGTTVITPGDGSASVQTNLGADDLPDVEDIRILQYKAWNATRKVPPLVVDGIEKYVVILHPSSLYWLEQDTVYQQMIREASTRGRKNQLFTGSVADIHGCILRKHEKLNAETNSTLICAVNVLLGAQAGIMAMAQNTVKWYEEVIDRGNKYHIGADITWGIKKCRFNSIDYGTYSFYCAAPVPIHS